MKTKGIYLLLLSIPVIMASDTPGKHNAMIEWGVGAIQYSITESTGTFSTMVGGEPRPKSILDKRSVSDLFKMIERIKITKIRVNKQSTEQDFYMIRYMEPGVTHRISWVEEKDIDKHYRHDLLDLWKELNSFVQQ